MTTRQQTPINNLPLGPEVRLLGSNRQGLIALEKPAGLKSHPNRQGQDARCLLTADYDYKNEVYAWETPTGIQRAWLLNRLDSPTSGVLLLAFDEQIVPVIRQLFASHKVKKTYYAIVKHTPSPVSGCWKDILKQDAYRSTKVNQSGRDSFAQTYYQVVSKSRSDIPISLIKLMPVTGRTHQLRIQCQYNRHPIVGDKTHGDFAFNRKVFSAMGEKRMMLHSAETELNYNFKGKAYNFQAKSELPEAFAKLLNS